MDNKNDIYHNDEINFNEVISKIWQAKLGIIFFAFILIFFASIYLQFAERKYTVQYKLKPVGESEQGVSLSGLGGFASLAGLKLPSNTSNDFIIFKELISSVEASEVVFKNTKLIKQIYADEWDSSLNNFANPKKNRTLTYIENFLKLITGSNDELYTPPNARRLAVYVYKKINISENKETGYLTIKAETAKPDMLVSLIIELAEASDEIMRQRYINFSYEPLSFYKEKLRESRSREHREALAELIANEEQKLMFASRNKHFIAEPYINPTISLDPTTPNSKLILVLALILGLTIGCFITLIKSAIMKDRL